MDRDGRIRTYYLARAEGVEPSVAASEAGRAPARPVLARVVGHEPTLAVSKTGPHACAHPVNVAPR